MKRLVSAIMAADPQDKKRLKAGKRKGHFTHNADSFAQFFNQQTAGSQLDPQTGTYADGPYRGKTPRQAQLDAKTEFQARAKSDPTYASRLQEQASPTIPQGTEVKQLPPALRNMPGAPDLTGQQKFDPKTGMQVSGPSSDAAARFTQMFERQKSNAAAGAAAVAAKKATQTPAAVVDSSIAAKNTSLARSGIVDMGGGNRAMSNKYGAGTATPGAPKGPAVIRDEKGTVDVAKMKGASTMPYMAGPTAQETGAASRTAIAGQAAAMTAQAPARLAADRANAIAKVTAAQPPAAAAATSPTIAPPPAPAAGTTAAVATAPKTAPAVAVPPPPNDTPGAASKAASAGMLSMKSKPTALPPSFQQKDPTEAFIPVGKWWDAFAKSAPVAPPM